MRIRSKLLLAALALIMILAAPALAGAEVNATFNGDPIPASGIYKENGITMISLDAFARISGADVKEVNEGAFSIVESDKVMSFTVGKNEAGLGGTTLALPAAPLRIQDNVYIPLREVCQVFGFEVHWDAAAGAVSLTRDEVRDGMTPMDLLVKTEQLSQEHNTYTMDGRMDMNIQIGVDGQQMEQPQKVTSNMNMIYQNKPMEIYIKQNVAAEAALDMPEMVMETYMTEDKMYMKAPGQEWVVSEMPFSPEFWEQQQDIQSNPLKAAEQMREMGILVNYGNDVTLEGKDYYVLNATLDMNKFREGIQNVMDQVMQAMGQGSGEVNGEETQQQIQKILENAIIDYQYTTYVNKETLFSDIVKFKAYIEMNLDMSGMAPAGDEEVKAPDSMDIKMDMEGEFKITGLDEPFVAPDVSNALSPEEAAGAAEGAGN